MRRTAIVIMVAGLAALGLSSTIIADEGTPTPGAAPAGTPGATPVAAMGDAEKGKTIAAQCIGCHSVDGSKLVGPSWKGIYGAEVEFEDGGKATVDEAYLVESIKDPMKHIVKGYPPAMPPYGATMTDEQIADVVAYIASLK